MFESTCSNCGLEVDPNRNYECPKCGYKFWCSKKFFEENLKKLPPLEKTSGSFEMQTKKIKKKIPFNFGFTSFRFLHLLAKSLILGVLAFVLTYGALKIYDQKIAEGGKSGTLPIQSYICNKSRFVIEFSYAKTPKVSSA